MHTLIIVLFISEKQFLKKVNYENNRTKTCYYDSFRSIFVTKLIVDKLWHWLNRQNQN